MQAYKSVGSLTYLSYSVGSLLLKVYYVLFAVKPWLPNTKMFKAYFCMIWRSKKGLHINSNTIEDNYHKYI